VRYGGVGVQAVKDHAAGCEARCSAAEAALKKAQGDLHHVQKELEDVREAAERSAARHAEEVEEKDVKWRFDLDEAARTAAKVRAICSVRSNRAVKLLGFLSDV
jgi:hypothetical protein